MIYAGIVAGGRGMRMGGSIPKQFMHIGDKPIIVHTVEKFLNTVDLIYVACPSEKVDYTKDLILKYTGADNVRFITGGITRMESIVNIVSSVFLQNKVTDEDIILTHDAIRPFINEKIIKNNIDAAKKYGACATFIPAIDTIASSVDGKAVNKIPPRDTMYNVQTPQTFNLQKLKTILAQSRDVMEQYTDLCGLAMNCGTKIRIVEGNRKNIKITTSTDVIMAEAILNAEK